MKLPIILLASAALVVPAHAADAAGLTSLDVCNAIGLTGLAISSDTACVQVSGEAYYEFHWGDYKGALPVLASGYSTTIDLDDDDGGASDWDSWVDTYLTFAASSASDFGTAKAVIELYGHDYMEKHDFIGARDRGVALEQAYVAIGDVTVLTAGLVTTSVFNDGDDDAFGRLASFISDETDGVAFDGGAGTYGTEGHAIQITSDLGGGFSTGIALEDLDGDGSLIGVIGYADKGTTAHVSFLAGDILDGTFDDFAVHSGVTLVFDTTKLRAAIAANNSGWWNGLVSAETTLDMFTLALTADATSAREFGLAGSVEARVTDAFTVVLAARYVDPDTALADDEGAELRARAEYALTEQLTLGAEIGHLTVGAAGPSGAQAVTDSLVDLTWNPGGDFEFSTALAANSIGAYEAWFAASKTFQ